MDRGMNSVSPIAKNLADRGVTFAPQIARAAQRYRLDPVLLAAIAAQETGGPGSNSGSNIVGDGGHGHGVFQIDDRWHTFARTKDAMDPASNADYAARMIRHGLDLYGGDVHKTLSAYNSGSPNRRGSTTTWGDGRVLGYADSVLRHYARLGGAATPAAAGTSVQPQNSAVNTHTNSLLDALLAERMQIAGSVNSLEQLALQSPPTPVAQAGASQTASNVTGVRDQAPDYAGLILGDGTD
jgi:transglycosylase-like protein with SLT domain